MSHLNSLKSLAAQEYMYLCMCVGILMLDTYPPHIPHCISPHDFLPFGRPPKTLL